MKIKIRDLGTVYTGNTPSKRCAEYYSSNDIPFVKPDDLVDDNIIRIVDSKEKISELARKKARVVKKGSVLFTCIGSIGKIGVVDCDEIAFNQQINSITPNDNINSKYLSYALMFNKNVIKSIANAPVVPIINKTQFEDIELRIEEDIRIQEEIASILDNVQLLIDKRKKQIDYYDELIKSRFIEMFGDPKDNPYGFEMTIIGECFKVKGGKRIPKGMGYSEQITDHPYLRATDMKDATILDDDIKYISDEVFQLIKNYTVSGGDIYITNVGVNLGMAGVIPEKYDGANLTENAVKLVPTQNKLIGIFISYYINSPGIQEYVNERKMSVGVPKLAIFRIESMPLIIPPIDLQQRFAAFVEQVDKSKSAMQKSLEEMETLYKSLLQKYFG